MWIKVRAVFPRGICIRRFQFGEEITRELLETWVLFSALLLTNLHFGCFGPLFSLLYNGGVALDEWLSNFLILTIRNMFYVTTHYVYTYVAWNTECAPLCIKTLLLKKKKKAGFDPLINFITC